MPDQANHPHLLAWYVSGDLDTSQARQTEEHLLGCSSCREELRALASMMQAVERASREPAGHDLQAEPMASSSLPGSAKSPGRAESGWSPRSRVIPPDAKTAGRSTRKTYLIMAGMVTLAGLVAVVATLRMNGTTSDAATSYRASPSSWPSGSQFSLPREVRPVTFLPLTRGNADAPKLVGPGPWAIRVILPFGAAAGTYLVRIEREQHGSIPVIETRAPTDADGRLTLILDAFAEPGRYSMVLAQPDQAGPSYSYPFEITAADAPPSS